MENNNCASHYVKCTLISLIIGEIATIIALLLCSLALCLIDFPSLVNDIFVIFAACFGGICAGFTNGIMIKKKGYLVGGICGLILSVILIAFKAIFFIAFSPKMMIIKVILVVACSAFGGIIGVNKKQKKY